MLLEVKLTPKVIIVTIVMATVCVWLFVSVVIILLPKRKETFVYKFDANMSIFDNDEYNSSYELNVQVIYLEFDSKEGTSKSTKA